MPSSNPIQGSSTPIGHSVQGSISPLSGQTSNGRTVSNVSLQTEGASNHEKKLSISKYHYLGLAILTSSIAACLFTAGAYTGAYFRTEPHALTTNSSYIYYKYSSTGIASLPSIINDSLTHSLSSTNQPLPNSFTSSSLFSSTGDQNDFETNSLSSSGAENNSSNSKSGNSLSTSASSISSTASKIFSNSSSSSSSSSSTGTSSSSSTAGGINCANIKTAKAELRVNNGNGGLVLTSTLSKMDLDGELFIQETWALAFTTYTALARQYLPAGQHALAIFDTSTCNLTGNELHVNARNNQHGLYQDLGAHTGDLANRLVTAYGPFNASPGGFWFTNSGADFKGAGNVIGKAMVLSSYADDGTTQPTGTSTYGQKDSGAICGIITAQSCF